MAPPKGHAPYPGCEKGGRPPNFTVAQIEDLAGEFLDWLDHEENLWIKDFCLEKNINPDCMSEWCDISEKFRGAYLLGKQKQESKILIGGLIGKYNSNIVKLALINHHGWADKHESKISGDSHNPLQFILDKVAESAKNRENETD